MAAVTLLLAGTPSRAATPANTLVVAQNINDIISLDPAECYEPSCVEIAANLYDRLLRIDLQDPAKVVPGVAESWTVSPDGKTFFFKIRPGQRFTTGNPVTAEDAAFSLRRVIKLGRAPAFLIGQFGWTRENVDEMVKAVAPLTLRATIGPTLSPSLVLSILSSIVGSVVERGAAEQQVQGGDFGNSWLKAHSAGSGPFSLRYWKANESVVLDAHPGYREGRPMIGRVVIRDVPEAAAQRLLIVTGDADIARDITPDQIPGLPSQVSVLTAPQTTLRYVSLNEAFVPFQDVRVRQALHYLVDYDGMAASFLKGQARVHQTFWPSGLWASLDKNDYRLDPAEAKRLLTEAGYPQGFEVTLDAANSALDSDIAQSIQASMALANVKVKVISAEQKALFTKYRARQHQMALSVWAPDYVDPHSNAMTFAYDPDNSDATAIKTLAWRNSWHAPEIMAEVDAALKEADAGKRAAEYRDLQNEVLDQGPYLILFQEIKQTVVGSAVKDFAPGQVPDLVFYDRVSKSS